MQNINFLKQWKMLGWFWIFNVPICVWLYSNSV